MRISDRTHTIWSTPWTELNSQTFAFLENLQLSGAGMPVAANHREIQRYFEGGNYAQENRSYCPCCYFSLAINCAGDARVASASPSRVLPACGGDLLHALRRSLLLATVLPDSVLHAVSRSCRHALLLHWVAVLWPQLLSRTLDSKYAVDHRCSRCHRRGDRSNRKGR